MERYSFHRCSLALRNSVARHIMNPQPTAPLWCVTLILAGLPVSATTPARNYHLRCPHPCGYRCYDEWYSHTSGQGGGLPQTGRPLPGQFPPPCIPHVILVSSDVCLLVERPGLLAPLHAPSFYFVSSVPSTSVPTFCSASLFLSCTLHISPSFLTSLSLGGPWQLPFPPPTAAYLCFILACSLTSPIISDPIPWAASLKKVGNRVRLILLLPRYYYVCCVGSPTGRHRVQCDCLLCFSPRRPASSSVSVTSFSTSMLLTWRALP